MFKFLMNSSYNITRNGFSGGGGMGSIQRNLFYLGLSKECVSHCCQNVTFFVFREKE